MRKKPIIRAEVRVNFYEVWTLPAGSFHRKGKRVGQPIARLWRSLLDQLRRQEREWWDSGPALKPELWGEFKSHVRVVYPDTRAFCRHCGRRFYCRSGPPSKWCSDRCATKARAPRIAATVRARSEARAKARAGRTCETCGEPLAAQRSTARFCSVRCRVAAHRDAARP